MKNTIIAGMILLACVGTAPGAEKDGGSEKNDKEEWRVMTSEEFMKVTGGRCPIVWKINPNDPSYDALVREKAAGGVLVVIAAKYLKSTRAVDMEGGNIEEWERNYPGELRESMGWAPFEPPVDIPRTNFPIRYERAFNEEILNRLAKDGLLVFSYASGIEDPDALAISKQCREAMGDRFMVMRRLEATNRLFSSIKGKAKKARLDPDKVTREQLFGFAEKYALGHSGCKLKGFGFGASNLELVQAFGIFKMYRWDTEYAHGSWSIHLAFSRGIKTQYGIPFLVYVACMNTNKDGLWGRNMAPNTPYERFYRYAYASGGKPSHLLNRIHWATWFGDADTIVGESSTYWCFQKGKDEDHFELSELGNQLKELNSLSNSDELDRGDPYVPACILLDYYNGWNACFNPDAHGWDPPGFMRRKIWGVKDYKKRDYMIDNFFGAVYPGYEMEGAWGSPSGEMTATPYGESFDVLLDNASADALEEYDVIFTVGMKDMSRELFEKLSAYVRNGGNLVLDSLLLTKDWKDALNIKTQDRKYARYYEGPGVLMVADSSKWMDDPVVKEKRYFYYIMDKLPKNAETLAVNPERGHPVLLKIPLGKGFVYYSAIQHMQESSGVYRPYGMTKCCKKLIRHVMDPYQKVFVDGEPVQYIVRTTDDKLLVMVINNYPEPWKGKLTFVPAKKKDKHSLHEWYVDGKPNPVEHKVTDDGVVFEDEIEGHSLRLYVAD